MLKMFENLGILQFFIETIESLDNFSNALFSIGEMGETIREIAEFDIVFDIKM